MAIRKYPNKKTLIDLYVIKKLSSIKIASMFNCSKPAILKGLKHYGIERRTLSESASLRSSWLKGKKVDRTKYPKMGHFQKHTEKSKEKNRQIHLKNPTRYWLGKHPTHMKGEKNNNWQGGISFEPYGLEFNKKLKEQIRKKYHYRCQQCFRHQNELLYKLSIHHIDFNKKNNSEENLIPLCRNCHCQTNFKRENWIDYFKNRITEGGGYDCSK